MALDKLGQWLQDTLQPGGDGKKVQHYTAKEFQSGKKQDSSKNSSNRNHRNSDHSSNSSNSSNSSRNSYNGSPRAATHRPTHSSRASSSHRPATTAGHSHRSPHPRDHAPKGTHVPNSKRLRIIPIGGLNEIGKNMMILEYDNDIVIIDMGFEFPSDDLLGIDYVIPDVSYLEERIHKIRGVIITHGHLDHTGGVPYILPRLNFPPVFGTKLTMGLVEKKLEEFKQLKAAKINTIDPDKPLRLGKFDLEFFRVNHSIPGCIGVVANTPAGTMVHTGDFKFDYTPADNTPADFQKIAMLGNRRIDALFADSTNATKSGHTLSERTIGKNLEKLIGDTEGRIIIASFSSLIGRIQQIIEAALKHNRKIYVSGRSMVDNIAIAQKLGYIKAPPHCIQDIRRAKTKPGKNAIILTTGSQGEDVSALSRMSLGAHQHIQVQPGDTVVISATPVPGNEVSMFNMINNLSKLGANVIHHKIMDIHTSGHGCQEDLKLMMSLVKPKHLVPIHGEYYMRKAHAELAKSLGFRDDQVVLAQNGSVIEIFNGKVEITKEQLETNYILVDGQGVGNLASEVIHERQAMSKNGVAIVLLTINKKTGKLLGDPEIITKGFIYQTETKKITQELQKQSREAYNSLTAKDPKAKHSDIKRYMTSRLDGYVHKALSRQPLVIPVIVEA